MYFILVLYRATYALFGIVLQNNTCSISACDPFRLIMDFDLHFILTGAQR